MSAYDDLMAYERDTQALGQVVGHAPSMWGRIK